MNNTHFPLLFLIDLDNTLIYTDTANNLAYKNAINRVLTYPESHILYNKIESKNSRITRNCLTDYELDSSIIDKIVSIKESEYQNLLPTTASNYNNIKALIQSICKKHQTSESNVIKIIVTNSHKERAKLTLNYHGLDDEFSDVICCNGINNKFDYALTKLNRFLSNKLITQQNIFIIDDDIHQINNVIEHNIPHENLYHYRG